MNEQVTGRLVVPGTDLEVAVSLENGDLTMVLTKANARVYALSSNKRRCRSRTRGLPICSCTTIAFISLS